MVRQFNRKEINERLHGKIAAKKPIVIGGAGIGLVAKIADQAGIDLLMGYNTGPFRMDGHGSLSGYLAYGDSNGMTLELGEHLLKVIKDTPLIGGIGAADPYRDIDALIDKMMDMGFSGITNVPTTGLYDGVFRSMQPALDILKRLSWLKNAIKRTSSLLFMPLTKKRQRQWLLPALTLSARMWV